jgi:hypothetical protein
MAQDLGANSVCKDGERDRQPTTERNNQTKDRERHLDRGRRRKMPMMWSGTEKERERERERARTRRCVGERRRKRVVCV